MIESVTRTTDAMRQALSGVVVGQREPVDELLAAWLAGG